MDIRIDTDKNNKPVAYKFLRLAMREVKMPLKDAEALIEAGGVNVTYGPNPFTPCVGIVRSENANGNNVTYTAYKVQL